MISTECTDSNSRSLGKKQLPAGFKDPSEWTYEQMRQWVREHDFPFEREASAAGATGKVVLNLKSLIFSVKGEVVGFDLGQLRTIENLGRDDGLFQLQRRRRGPQSEVDPCRCEHGRRFPSRSEDFGVGPRCYSSG